MQIKNEPTINIPTPDKKQEKIEKSKEQISSEKKEAKKPIKPNEIKKPNFKKLDKKGLAGSNVRNAKFKREIKEVESIMTQNLEEIYNSLPEDLKRNFKQTGEQTALEIHSLLKKTKVKVKKILILLKKWLSIIPGVSSFYLEQDSKIKTDALLKNKTNW